MLLLHYTSSLPPDYMLMMAFIAGITVALLISSVYRYNSVFLTSLLHMLNFLKESLLQFYLVSSLGHDYHMEALLSCHYTRGYQTDVWVKYSIRSTYCMWHRTSGSSIIGWLHCNKWVVRIPTGHWSLVAPRVVTGTICGSAIDYKLASWQLSVFGGKAMYNSNSHGYCRSQHTCV